MKKYKLTFTVTDVPIGAYTLEDAKLALFDYLKDLHLADWEDVIPCLLSEWNILEDLTVTIHAGNNKSVKFDSKDWNQWLDEEEEAKKEEQIGLSKYIVIDGYTYQRVD